METLKKLIAEGTEHRNNQKPERYVESDHGWRKRDAHCSIYDAKNSILAFDRPSKQKNEVEILMHFFLFMRADIVWGLEKCKKSCKIIVNSKYTNILIQTNIKLWICVNIWVKQNFWPIRSAEKFKNFFQTMIDFFFISCFFCLIQ